MQKEKLYIPIAIIIGAVIIAGAIFYTTKISRESSPQKEVISLQPGDEDTGREPVKITITKENHIKGDFEAQVTIVEYSDFQCPFCAKFHPTLQQILQEYQGKVRWVYKHFPLDQIHPQARPAAEASECIFEQKGNDGFWQFADALFENQSKLGESFYKELASQIGVNTEQFSQCLSSRKYKDKVETDYQEGIKAGVRGTPGSFVNGEPLVGAVPYETVKTAVNQTLVNLK